jgi:tryptophan synthase alpha chain
VSLETFVKDRLQGRKALVMAHTVVGYPSIDANWTMLESMQKAGVDLVELQLPFSEPIADGPRFVRANQQAIDSHLRWQDYFEFFSRASQELELGLLFMGYYNSVHAMGEAEFTTRLADAGARGFIVADLPPEEAENLNREGRERGLDPVLLMTPTNSQERLAAISAQASGMVYCVARKGVTGKQTDFTADVSEFLERCRNATSLPLGLGFGIKRPEDVRAVRDVADIAIVGTACLEAWEAHGANGYQDFLESLVAETK